ncbi:MAG: hypothetical protein JXD22_10630 [Sedimentisphaerales bacterium]|nr:hypothetical protein [Sedimentisphaerales bacterium]
MINKNFVTKLSPDDCLQRLDSQFNKTKLSKNNVLFYLYRFRVMDKSQYLFKFEARYWSRFAWGCGQIKKDNDKTIVNLKADSDTWGFLAFIWFITLVILLFYLFVAKNNDFSDFCFASICWLLIGHISFFIRTMLLVLFFNGIEEFLTSTE